MKLIAKKPCSFGGKQFFIGEEIPADIVKDKERQEHMGVLAIVNEWAAPAIVPGASYSHEQVEQMISEAVDEALKNAANELEEANRKLEEAVSQNTAELGVTDGMTPDKITISVLTDSDDENEQKIALVLSQEEVQQTFEILQMNAENGAKAIESIESESVLILLHATDERKTIKNAARKQVSKLFPNGDDSDESSTDNATTGDNTEGADT